VCTAHIVQGSRIITFSKVWNLNAIFLFYYGRSKTMSTPNPINSLLILILVQVANSLVNNHRFNNWMCIDQSTSLSMTTLYFIPCETYSVTTMHWSSKWTQGLKKIKMAGRKYTYLWSPKLELGVITVEDQIFAKL
jgi:hypothetical protein